MPQSSPDADEAVNAAFSQHTNGATSTSAGLASPITPFSQSALPSKSLLSRPETSMSAEPGQAKAGTSDAEGTTELPLVLQRGVQSQLNTVIDRLFERCFQQKRYRQVIGIAVESGNLEMVRTAILRATEDEKPHQGEESKIGEELMEYVLGICMNVVEERSFRNKVRENRVFRNRY